MSKRLLRLGEKPAFSKYRALWTSETNEQKAQEGDGLAGEFAGYVTGNFTGIGWTFCRFGSGVVDIVSAPFPGNEEELIKPEFISDEKILSET